MLKLIKNFLIIIIIYLQKKLLIYGHILVLSHFQVGAMEKTHRLHYGGMIITWLNMIDLEIKNWQL